MKSASQHRLITIQVVVLIFVFCSVSAKKVITIPPIEGDMTPVVRQAIENSKDEDIKIVFEKGTYTFLPDYAFDSITQWVGGLYNGQMKRTVFLLEGFSSVEVEGNGAEFIFHGQVCPFHIIDCGQVTLKNFVVDWDIPFLFQAENIAVNPEEGWRDVRPMTEGFSWKLERNQILFPGVDGFNYDGLGQSLSFDPVTKNVVHGERGLYTNPIKVEERPGGILRIHEPMKYFPQVGSVTVSKGDRPHNRYSNTIQIDSSKNVLVDNVVLHHGLAIGFFFFRTENIQLLKSGVYVREGSKRLVSVTADASHFADCRGDILVENCRFESMLDDGANVHGTYVYVDKILNDKTIRIAVGTVGHFGIPVVEAGDEMWFLHQPVPERTNPSRVVAVTRLNGKYADLTFQNKLPVQLAVGDVLENKTWHPTFTMRNCTIKNHRARSVMIKTPRRLVIEDNYFSSQMSSIMTEGNLGVWWESGSVADVVIRNNHFVNCAHASADHAVFRASSTLPETYNQSASFDRNIRIENNTIELFDNRLVRAERLEGLVFRNNTIKTARGLEPLYPDTPLFEFTHCRDIEIVGNTYEGDATRVVEADADSKAEVTLKDNIGF